MKKWQEGNHIPSFMGMFNFLGLNLESMHAYSQACLPLLDFFNHVVHFWELVCTPFIDALISP
jgi:hypothetical protein